MYRSPSPRFLKACAISAVCLLLLFSATRFSTRVTAQASCAVPPTGLVSWWPGEGNANDLNGANNGTLPNGASFSPGHTGQAFNFTGYGDSLPGEYVSVEDDETLNSPEITVEGWFLLRQRPQGVRLGGTDQFVLASKYSGNYQGWIIRVGNDLVPIFSVHRGAEINTAHVASSVPIELNTWVHIAASYDGATARIYVNGFETGSLPLPGGYAPYGGVLRIGMSSWWPGNFMNGLADEISIYNHALSASEVQTIYDASSAGKCHGPLPVPTPTPITQITPVIVIPGTGGSLLGIPNGRSPNREGFPGDILLGNSGNPENLQFTENGQPRSDTISHQLEPLSMYREINDLTSFLISNSNVYTRGENLFEFPYDFRRSVEYNASALANRINVVKGMTGAQKVDIVAHSLGGLVAKQYLKDFADSNDVGTLIMIGTPQLGTPKAFKILRYGEKLDTLADKCKVKRASHNLPGLFAQLPGQRYFEKVGGYFKDSADINSDGVRGLIINFTRMSNTIKYGVESPNFLCPLNDKDAEPRNILSSTLIDDGMISFHNNLDYWQKPADVKVFVIAGYGLETISEIIEAESNRYFRRPERFAFPIFTTAGDETVPMASAETVDANAVYYADLAALRTTHSKMPGDSQIQRQVLGLLRNGAGIYGSDIKLDRPFVFRQTITYSTFSPVRLSVYDSHGNHCGFLPDGSTESNIPGCSVTEMGEVQHIAVPEGDRFIVIVKGLDSGSYTLWQTELDEQGKILHTFSWENVPVSAGSTGTLVSQFNDPQNLVIDDNGDGSSDYSLSPNVYNGGVGPMRTADLNNDNKQDIDDFIAMRSAFGTCTGQTMFLSAADFDDDGCVTLKDYQFWVSLLKGQ